MLGVVGAALFLAPAPGAVAQPGDTSSPFSPGLPSGPSTPTTTAAPQVLSNTSTSGGGSLSGGSAIAIAIGAVVLLGGISFFLWPDARRRGPAGAREASRSTCAPPAPAAVRQPPRCPPPCGTATTPGMTSSLTLAGSSIAPAAETIRQAAPSSIPKAPASSG